MTHTTATGSALTVNPHAQTIRELTLAVDCCTAPAPIALAQFLCTPAVVAAFAYAAKWARHEDDGAEYDENEFNAAFQIVPSALRARIALDAAWDHFDGTPDQMAVCNAIIEADEALAPHALGLYIVSPAVWADCLAREECLGCGGIWFADAYVAIEADRNAAAN